jgi:hypothetical protein
MIKTYSITFKGSAGGTFNYVSLQLGGTTVRMTTNDRVTWTNSNFQLDVTPPLHIHLECGAGKGTTWDISITQSGGGAACYTASGITGDQPGGTSINISVRDADTNC